MADCPSCHAEVLPGTRWCSICHIHLVNQEVGRLAPPAKRLGAFFLDLFMWFIWFVLPTVLGGENPVLNVLGGLLILAYIIWAFSLFVRGTSPGKKLLGLQVVKEDGSNARFFTMLIRDTIGKLLSGAILSLGYLWLLFDRENQGWHDKFMRTYVVEKG